MFKFILKSVLAILLVAGGVYNYFYYWNYEDKCQIRLDPVFNSKIQLSDVKQAIAVLKNAFPGSYQDLCQNVKIISTERGCVTDEIKSCDARSLEVLRKERIINVGTDKTGNFGFTAVTLAKEACFMAGIKDAMLAAQRCEIVVDKIKNELYKY